METYWSLADKDLDTGVFLYNAKKFREAVFYFQQAAEKYSKFILELINPIHIKLRTHLIEHILSAYNSENDVNDLGSDGRYLTSFYFNTRYPGDNYQEIAQAQADKALSCVNRIKTYCVKERQLIEATMLSRRERNETEFN